MHIVPRNMCTKFNLKMLNWFLSYEVKIKFCDNADNPKGIIIPTLFLRKTDRLKIEIPGILSG